MTSQPVRAVRPYVVGKLGWWSALALRLASVYLAGAPGSRAVLVSITLVMSGSLLGCDARLGRRGCRYDGTGEAGQHFVPVAEHPDGPFRQNKNLVGHAEDAGTVRNDDDGGSGTLHFGVRGAQCGLALVTQLGVGLAQDDKAGAAIDRAGKADALALSARQGAAAVADRRIVSLGQAQDHVMDAGTLGGGHDGLTVHIAEAGDVLGDRAVEQFDVLGQVAHEVAT